MGRVVVRSRTKPCELCAISKAAWGFVRLISAFCDSFRDWWRCAEYRCVVVVGFGEVAGKREIDAGLVIVGT